MPPRFATSALRLKQAHFRTLLVALCLVSMSAVPLQAKSDPLIAIEVYNSPNGYAYVHIIDVLIDGKAELRACGTAQHIDKSAYGKLEKVNLGPGAALEYGAGGALTLTKDGKRPALCQVE